MEPIKKADRPCPICGGSSYCWGTLMAMGFKFYAEDTSWFTKLLPNRGNKLPARRCNGCGNIQIFSPEREYER